jgi:hypothetical protein
LGGVLISGSAEVVERDITPESENLKSGSWGSMSPHGLKSDITPCPKSAFPKMLSSQPEGKTKMDDEP